MEYGYFHPSCGYWQTTELPPDNILESYPEGTLQIPLKTGPNTEWDGTAWVSSEPIPPEVPQAVTRFQAMAALHLAGLLTTVEEIMSSPETSVVTKLAWNNALTFERNSPMLMSLSGTLSLSSQDIDNLFMVANGIQA